jgi:hypothetical protein
LAKTGQHLLLPEIKHLIGLLGSNTKTAREEQVDTRTFGIAIFFDETQQALLSLIFRGKRA